MDADALRDLAVGDHELEAGVAGICDLPAGGRAHHEDPRWTERLPQRQPFRHRRDAERGRSGPERGAADVDRAVPVAVRLDDRPELGALESAEQRPDVPPDRTQVDDQIGARHAPDARATGSGSRRWRGTCPCPGRRCRRRCRRRRAACRCRRRRGCSRCRSCRAGSCRPRRVPRTSSSALPPLRAPRDDRGHGDPVAGGLRLLLVDRDRADIALRARHRHRVRRRERRDQHEPTRRSDRGVACEPGRPHRRARRSRAARRPHHRRDGLRRVHAVAVRGAAVLDDVGALVRLADLEDQLALMLGDAHERLHVGELDHVLPVAGARRDGKEQVPVAREDPLVLVAVLAPASRAARASPPRSSSDGDPEQRDAPRGRDRERERAQRHFRRRRRGSRCRARAARTGRRPPRPRGSAAGAGRRRRTKARARRSRRPPRRRPGRSTSTRGSTATV